MPIISSNKYVKSHILFSCKELTMGDLSREIAKTPMELFKLLGNISTSVIIMKPTILIQIIS
jgi:hypothetical protein